METQRRLFAIAMPTLRSPAARDSAPLRALARDLERDDDVALHGGLDLIHVFAQTSVVAELRGEVVGAACAYPLPSDPTTLYVWGVLAKSGVENTGLDRLMLQSLLARPDCQRIARIQTAVRSHDAASWACFQDFAAAASAEILVRENYIQASRRQNRHKIENIVTVQFPLGEDDACAAPTDRRVAQAA